MSGAYYIMLINMALATMLLLGFGGFWLYDRKRKAPLYFFYATLLFVVQAGIELSSKHVPVDIERMVLFCLYIVNFSAGMLLTIGVATHYKMEPHWKRMALVFLAGIVITIAVLDMPRQSVLRMVINQTPIVVALVIGAVRLWLLPRKTTLDTLLLTALIVFSVNLAARPAILAIYGTMGETLADFQQTQYALITQFLLTIVTMATATILMLVMIADMMHELTKQSLRDSMTGLLNRKGFDNQATNTLQKLDRSDVPAAMIMCDIDHFKSINDEYGHDVGDKVISYFGRMLGNMGRRSDLIARVGGEEFCLFLWNCDLENSRAIADDIRGVFNQIRLPFLPEDHSLSASFGIATFQSGDRLEDIYKRADIALYQAKNGGRNKVHVYQGESDTTEIPARPMARAFSKA